MNWKIDESIKTFPCFQNDDPHVLGQFLENFSICNTVDEKINEIKRLFELREPATEAIRYKFLSFLFLTSPYKHPIKKFISRQLQKNIPEDILIGYLKEIITSCKNGTQFSIVLNTIFDNFPPGVIAIERCLDKILEIVCQNLGYYSQKINTECVKKEILIELHDFSRAIISIFTHCSPVESNTPALFKIFEISLEILRNQNVQMDTRTNFGIIFILTAYYSKRNQGFLEIVYKILNLKRTTEELWPKINFGTMSEKIIIINGILNARPVDVLQVVEDDEQNQPIVILLGKYLLEIAETSCKSIEKDELLVVQRSIVFISKKMSDLPSEIYTFEFSKLITKFSLNHLEHYIDTVRHNVKTVLINTIRMAFNYFQNGNSDYLDAIIQDVFDITDSKSVFYSCLTILCTEVGFNTLLKYDSKLPGKFLNDLYSFPMYSNQIRTAYITFMKKHASETDTKIWSQFWIEPLIIKVFSNQNIEENLFLIIEGLTIKPELTIFYIEKYLDDYSKYPLLLLQCAKIARKNGITGKNESTTYWKGIIPTNYIEKAFCHIDSEVRLVAIGLFAEINKTTEMFSTQDFHLILTFLKFNINCQEPSVRQQILSFYKKIFHRINDSYNVIKKSLNNLEKKLTVLTETVHENMNTVEINQLATEIETKHKLVEYENVVMEFRKFLLEQNLFPGANYYRRNLTLQLYTLLKSILDENFPFNKWTKTQTEGLMFCLYDSYEQNKKLALDILFEFPAELVQCADISSATNIISKCLELAGSNRPTDCISGAYLLHLSLNYPATLSFLQSKTDLLTIQCPYYLATKLLLNKLIDEFTVARENILVAAVNGPMYGCIFILRYLYLIIIQKIEFDEKWREIITEIIELCLKISKIVTPIVNNQSPEGYMPTVTDEKTNNLIVTPQMVLLCAWRSVKEISLLFGEISLSLKSGETVEIVSQQQICNIGEYFMDVLADTKHRGAFEQTYVGFTKLCKRLWCEQNERLSKLPQKWLTEIFESIEDVEKAKNKKLCATRRSAGIPFMVQALLTTNLEVSGNANLFKNHMKTLLEMAANNLATNFEFSTHAMNILRALFRHTQLNEYCMQYVADGIMVAVQAIDGKTWGVRNAGTLLFSTLMTRIFGVLRSKHTENISSRNRMTVQLFFQRYPKLYDFLLDELQASCEFSRSGTLKLSLYPILLLLARLYPSVFEGNETRYQISAFLPYLNQCSGNRILKTRELTAKAIVPLLNKLELLKYFENLINRTIHDISSNYCHGLLLQILYILKTLSSNENQLGEFWDCILKIDWIIFSESCLLKDLYCQILIELLRKRTSDTRIGHYLERVIAILNLPPSNSLLNHPGIINFEITFTNLKLHAIHLIDLKQNREEYFLDILYKALLSNNINLQSFLLDVALNLFFEKSYLFDDVTEFEIFEYEFLKNFNKEFLYKLLLKNRKFFEIFKYRLHTSTDQICKAKFYFLLSLFGKSINQFFDLNEDGTVSRLVYLTTIETELVQSYILKCLLNYLTLLIQDDTDISNETLNQLYRCIYENSLPETDYKNRRIICEFLVQNPKIFEGYWKYSCEQDLCKVWLSIQLLGNDSEESIRETVTKIIRIEPVVYESVRDAIFNMSVNILRNKCPENFVIAYLLYWIVRDTSVCDPENDDEIEVYVFNKSDINMYIEDVYLAKLATASLKSISGLSRNLIMDVLNDFNLINWWGEDARNGRMLLLNGLKTEKQINQWNAIHDNLLLYKINNLLSIL